MKRITPLSIILWSVLFTIGTASAVCAVIFKNISLILWILAVATWIVDGVLITMGIVRSLRRGPKTPAGAVFAGNQAGRDRVMRETNEAVSRYVTTVNRKGF